MKICLLVILLLIFPVFSYAQAKRNQDAGEAIKEIRDDYFNRRFADGERAGKILIRRFPANAELRAWYISNLAVSAAPEKAYNGLKYNPLAAQAVMEAKAFASRLPSNAWSSYTLGKAYCFNGEFAQAQAALEKALRREPDNAEFIFTRAECFADEYKFAEMTEWLNRQANKKLNEPRLLSLRLRALIDQTGKSADRITEIEKTFDRALKLEPKNINTSYLYAQWLAKNKQFKEACFYFRKLIGESPKDVAIRQDYWKALAKQPAKTESQKATEIQYDITDFLKVSTESAEALVAAAQNYDELKNYAARESTESLIARRFPATRYAEIIAFSHLTRALQPIDESESEPSAEAIRQAISLERNFIGRPVHFDTRKIGVAYFSLLERLGNTKTASDKELSELISGTLKYHREPLTNNNSTIAKVLSEGITLRPHSRLNNQAEKYALGGIREAESISPDEQPERKLYARGQALNVLGYVLTSAGKYPQAERTLLDAQQLFKNEPSSFFARIFDAENKNYLAELYLAEKAYDKAEELYLDKALADDSAARTFFAKLYERKTGGIIGFEDYYREIRGRLKKRVLESRIKTPKDAAAFSLKTIDGKTISSVDLKGKILIINVWGTWCAPCVGEMPQLQKLYQKYAGEHDLAIVTMDVEDELETVRKFIAAKGYSFPVLVGDSYKNNFKYGTSVAFPTTIFIGRTGKVEFVKIGASASLFEEFSWRIEALRNN